MSSIVSDARRGSGAPRVPSLAVLCAVAVTLRLVAALAMGDAVEPLPGIHDQISYDALARRVALGEGFSFDRDWWPLTRAGEPTAHWSFLYTGFLAAVYTVAGPHPLAARVVQAVCAGVLLTWGAFRLGRVLFGPGPARWAAGAVAVYPYFVYYGAALMSEAFTLAAVVWLLALAIEGAERPAEREKSAGGGAARWSSLGLLLGATALLRQVAALPALVALAAAAARRSATRGRRAALLALCVAVATLLVLPVTWRNHRSFGRWVPINTNAGYAFFWANHPVHGSDFVSILPDDGPGYVELVPPSLRGLDEAALGDALFALGLGFVRDEPGRFLRLSASRVDDYFLFWPTRTSSAASNLARVLSFGLALPFMAAGLALSLASWRRCLPCYLFAGAYVAIHLLSWALVRYRLPVDAVLLVFAGLALDRVARALSGSRRAAAAT